MPSTESCFLQGVKTPKSIKEPSYLCAIASSLEAIASRLEAITTNVTRSCLCAPVFVFSPTPSGSSDRQPVLLELGSLLLLLLPQTQPQWIPVTTCYHCECSGLAAWLRGNEGRTSLLVGGEGTGRLLSFALPVSTGLFRSSESQTGRPTQVPPPLLWPRV